jgi:hypothetical protein
MKCFTCNPFFVLFLAIYLKMQTWAVILGLQTHLEGSPIAGCQQDSSWWDN